MTRRARADYLGLVEIRLPRWIAALQRLAQHAKCAARRAYLRHQIASVEKTVAIHEHHAELEPKLAALARGRAAELRVELATLTPLKGSE